MINVLIVDDHQLLREGLRSRLERESGIASRR
jgi:DNA-binding NarL/FixJ family response regulator